MHKHKGHKLLSLALQHDQPYELLRPPAKAACIVKFETKLLYVFVCELSNTFSRAECW